jgi:ABC-type phosphonate transport system ATPase subunit
LYLNDQLLEEKAISTENQTKYIAQFKVNYQPGELKAVGVESGEEKESVILRTAGTPVEIRLTPDRRQIKNSRNDLSYVQIELVDKDGLVVPDADCQVQLSVSGQGEIAAAGNASPTDMESFRSLSPKTFHGKALAIVRPTGQSGTVVLNAVADGLPAASVKIKVN